MKRQHHGSRNHIARASRMVNRPKVVQSKKVYNRKRFDKSGSEYKQAA